MKIIKLDLLTIIASEKKSGNQKRGRMYITSTDKGKKKQQQKTLHGKEINGGGDTSSLKCFKYGVLGHHYKECTSLIVSSVGNRDIMKQLVRIRCAA